MSELQYISFYVTPDSTGRRIENILHSDLHMARSMITRLKHIDRAILCNGIPCRVIDRVISGDRLEVYVGDSVHSSNLNRLTPSFPIVFEDDCLLVVDKPAGLAVYGNGHTMADDIIAYLGNGSIFHPVNRLDLDTSGIMVIAKSGYIHDLLRQSLHTNNFRRFYLAAVEGMPPQGIQTIDYHIRQENKFSSKRVIDSNGQYARTDYTVLSTKDGCSFVIAKLYTGRTHQIRVHFSALGYPLLGDTLYGHKSEKINRTALHSTYLLMKHPLTGKVFSLYAPLPEDMRFISPNEHVLESVLYFSERGVSL